MPGSRSMNDVDGRAIHGLHLGLMEARREDRVPAAPRMIDPRSPPLRKSGEHSGRNAGSRPTNPRRRSAAPRRISSFRSASRNLRFRDCRIDLGPHGVRYDEVEDVREIRRILEVGIARVGSLAGVLRGEVTHRHLYVPRAPRAVVAAARRPARTRRGPALRSSSARRGRSAGHVAVSQARQTPSSRQIRRGVVESRIAVRAAPSRNGNSSTRSRNCRWLANSPDKRPIGRPHRPIRPERVDAPLRPRPRHRGTDSHPGSARAARQLDVQVRDQRRVPGFEPGRTRSVASVGQAPGGPGSGSCRAGRRATRSMAPVNGRPAVHSQHEPQVGRAAPPAHRSAAKSSGVAMRQRGRRRSARRPRPTADTCRGRRGRRPDHAGLAAHRDT